MTNPEFNKFKSAYFINLVGVFLSLTLLLFMPFSNDLAYTYFLIMIGGMVIVIADMVMIGEEFEFFNTGVADYDSSTKGKMYLLQNFLPFKYCMLVAVLAGLALAGMYSYSIIVQRTPYIAVPRLFSAPPVNLSAQAFDAWQTGYAVGNVEELAWIGIMFHIIWMPLAFIAMFKIKDRATAFFIAMIIAALITGWLASFVFHIFVYQGNLYAYANGQFHFTVSALLAGTTGTIAGGVIAHAIHNSVVVSSYQSQAFAVIPIQAYRGEEAERTFE